MINPEELLICRIFEQAIEDYKELKEKHIEYEKDNSSVYSIKDIEVFFNSNWCSSLLAGIRCKLNGDDILAKIQRQCV